MTIARNSTTGPKVAAITSLMIGAAIYLIARPDSLLMFQWLDLLGLSEIVSILRSTLRPEISSFSTVIVFSAPLALWLLSFCIFSRIIWNGDHCQMANFWFWSLPATAAISELGQAITIVPGTFDILDLCLISITPFFAKTFL